MTVIKLSFLFLFSASSICAQTSSKVMHDIPTHLELNGASLNELYQVDSNFSALEPFGEPLRVDSIYKSAEPKWIFYYDGFTLSYVQFFPSGPELVELQVSNDNVEFKSSTCNLFKEEKYLSKKRRSRFVLTELDDETKDAYSTQSFIEFIYKDKQLQKIIYKIDPNL